MKSYCYLVFAIVILFLGGVYLKTKPIQNQVSIQKNDINITFTETSLLNHLEKEGFSFSTLLGEKKAFFNTANLYKTNSLYKSFVHSLGVPLNHDAVYDQLPTKIPNNSGDIPEMVRLLRNFEDKGARSNKDLTQGFKIRKLSNNSSFPYHIEYDGDEPRYFDYRWLYSPFAQFKLIALVNRIDKMDFYPNTCGEVRFIFRLMYKTAHRKSSLPFFINMVFSYPQQNCRTLASTWLIPASTKNKANDLAKHLKENSLQNLQFKQMEINFQSLRFTSGYMHDFGGQAMYMQRVFIKSKNKFIPTVLENTPDVLAIEENPTLVQDFVQYLKQDDNLMKLDQGTLNIQFNENFLAKRSISWSTLGRSRTANKPYRKIFAKHQDLLHSIDISQLNYIKSHDALLERLDNLTCMGCHQMGGMAGFHMHGESSKDYSHHFNQQALAFSPHVIAEHVRRKAYLNNLIQNKTVHRFRPHSSQNVVDWATTTALVPEHTAPGIKSLCILNNTHFKQMSTSCAPFQGQETVCMPTITQNNQPNLFGECVLKESGDDFRQHFAGSVCWQGELNQNLTLPNDRISPTYNFYAFQDKWKLLKPVHSQRGENTQSMRYSCGTPQGGTPLGRKSRPCTPEEENFTILDHLHPNTTSKQTHRTLDLKNFPAELCANQGGNGFDRCAAAGDAGQCLSNRVARAMLDSCSWDRPCREDYICQKFPDYHLISDKDYGRVRLSKKVNASSPKNIDQTMLKQLQDNDIGFCVPTYFLFNLRVDGHPNPMSGKVSLAPNFHQSNYLRGYKQ